jgi:hypothetical protein
MGGVGREGEFGDEGRGEKEGKKENIPSSLPNTLLTAPEHPPHDIATLNL